MPVEHRERPGEYPGVRVVQRPAQHPEIGQLAGQRLHPHRPHVPILADAEEDRAPLRFGAEFGGVREHQPVIAHPHLSAVIDAQ